MAKKSFSAAKLLKPKGTSFLWLALLPVAAVLFAKHADVKADEHDAYIYAFGKRKKPGGAVIVTNQTPSELAKTAVRNCFKIKN